jgi:hypothetical protein
MLPATEIDEFLHLPFQQEFGRIDKGHCLFVAAVVPVGLVRTEIQRRAVAEVRDRDEPPGESALCPELILHERLPGQVQDPDPPQRQAA